MELVRLDAEGMARVYREHMTRDFPADELKPLAALLRSMERGFCAPFALTDAGGVAAYAVTLRAKPGEAGILDYLAVTPGLRGRGLGGEALRRLRAELTDVSGLLIEYECPSDAAGDAERAQRLRRERFYRRNGMRATRIDLMLFGVHYSVGYLPFSADWPDAALKRMQADVYRAVRCREFRFLDNL